MSDRGRSDADFLDGLQYLRGIAAMMVVFHHARPFVGSGMGLDFGARGVELFFVISGLVMMQSTRGSTIAQALPWRDRWQVVGDFLKRRIARVVPLYWIAIPTFVAASGVCRVGCRRELLEDAFFVPHWNVVDPTKVWPTLVPGWTLNLEMLFYALFGCALVFGRIGPWLTCGVIAALVSLRGAVDPHSAAQFLYTDSVMLCFVTGVLLYWPVRSLRGVAWAAPSAMAVASLGFAVLILRPDFPSALYLPILAGLIVGGTAISAHRLVAARVLLPFMWLGEASYSIYLSHPMTLELMKPVTGRLPIDASSHAGAMTHFAVNLSAAALAGVLVHLVLERALLSGARVALGLKSSGRAPVGSPVV